MVKGLFTTGKWKAIQAMGIISDSFNSISESADNLMREIRDTLNEGTNPATLNLPVPDFRLVNDLCLMVATHLTDESYPNTIFILLDQYDDLTIDQQRSMNLLFRNPVPRGYHLKIGVRPWGMKTHDVASVGGPLRVDQDYFNVNLEFLEDNVKTYEGLLSNICRKRLALWKSQNPNQNVSQDIHTYLKTDFSQCAYFSSGIVHQFILLCQEIFTERFDDTNTALDDKSIPSELIHRCIRKVSTRQSRDLLGTSIGHPDRTTALVSHLCNVALKLNRSEGTEHDKICFAIRNHEALEPENLEVLRHCVMDSIFQELSDEFPGQVDDALSFQLNRIFWPARDLSLNNAGVYEIQAGELNDKMEPFVPPKQRRKEESLSLFPSILDRQLQRQLLQPTQHRRTKWLDNLNRVTNELGSHCQVLANNMMFSLNILDSLEKHCMGWFEQGKFDPELSSKLCVIFGGSFGRLEAAEGVSDADFFILVEPGQESERASIKLFNMICFWLKEHNVRVEADVPIVEDFQIDNFEVQGFPKIVKTTFPIDNWEKIRETGEAKTMRLVIMTEGNCVFNQKFFQTYLQKLREGYKFSEWNETNTLQKVFLNDFSSWCDQMWTRTFIRDKPGELAFVKLGLHRAFLRRATSLSILAHVAFGDESTYSTQHEVLQVPPINRLITILDKPRGNERVEIQDCIRNILSDYNDAQKAVSNPELRSYWDNPQEQINVEQKDQARFSRLREQVGEIDQSMAGQFDRLRKLLFSRLTARDKRDFEATMGI